MVVAVTTALREETVALPCYPQSYNTWVRTSGDTNVEPTALPPVHHCNTMVDRRGSTHGDNRPDTVVVPALLVTLHRLEVSEAQYLMIFLLSVVKGILAFPVVRVGHMTRRGSHRPWILAWASCKVVLHKVEVAVEVGEALERTVAGYMVVRVAAVGVVVEVGEAAVVVEVGGYDSARKTLDLRKASSLCKEE